jgi:transposase
MRKVGGKGGGHDGLTGYDAGKKVKGRKIHALVDTQGLPLRVAIHSAGLQDREGAALVLDKIRNSFPWLELVWANSADITPIRSTRRSRRFHCCASKSLSAAMT